MSARPAKDTLGPLWKGLSDRTRREILDLLRKGPMTTGALAEEFRSSRFAVMKHLEVLVDVGLVVSRRRGRERWNHLNAVPLQQLYERWVRPYEAHWSDRLMQLKNSLETPNQGAVMEQASVLQVELEIEINATPERVWKAITEETTFWWRKDFYAHPDTKKFVFEPKVGGRVFEDAGGGAGLLWYTVLSINPNKSVDLRGQLTAAFGGPAMTMLTIELVAAGKKTKVKLSDSVIGRVTEKTAASLRSGWQQLIGEGLKPYVEK